MNGVIQTVACCSLEIRPRLYRKNSHRISRFLALSCVALLVYAGSVVPTLAANQSVNLKVLVVSVGTAEEDLGLDFIDDALEELGVPYDVLDSTRVELDASMLSDGADLGYYNGIILTSTDMYTPNGSAFSTAEWQLLHDYEINFGVRESVIAGWPGTYPDLGVDYGMNGATYGTAFTGRWVAPAGGTEIFEYVNTSNTLEITDFALAAIPRNDGTGPTVTPLLVDDNAPSNTFVALLDYPDGRQVLLSTITNAWFLIHSQVLAYEFINFATDGLFLGNRQVHLTAHLDDLFLPNSMWDSSLNVTDPSVERRLSGQDITDGVAAQNDFRAAHSTVGTDFKLDFPFNGAGASSGEDLTDTVVTNKDEFRYINHTFTHADMDTAHPEIAECDYETLTSAGIRQEINKNRTVWRNLGLPDRGKNNRVLVSGNHSGLSDRYCTDEGENAQSDDIQFFVGANPEFLDAAQSRNVRYLAGDSSRLNQASEQYIPGYNLILLPRYPTSVFVNTIDPDQLTDEYNYVFHERFNNSGQDPCFVPGAICSPREYDEILQAEANTTVRHMLTYRKWPHYFHQSNLVNYSVDSSSPRTLMFDWLEAVVTDYEQVFNLPIMSLPFWRIGDLTRDRLAITEAAITARLDRVTDSVALSADRAVSRVPVTGLKGGSVYGGQRQRTINLSTSTKNIRVDRLKNL